MTAGPADTAGPAVVSIPDSPSAPAASPSRGVRAVLPRLWGWLHLDPAGLALATFFFCLSLTPSLVPRAWTFQALVSGITMIIGYALGVLLGIALRLLWRPFRSGVQVPAKVVVGLWWSGGLIGVVAVVGYLVASASWQTQLRELIRIESPGPSHYLWVVLLAFVMLIAIITVWRLLRWSTRRLSRVLARRVPPTLSLGVASLVVGAVFGSALNGVLVPAVLGAVNDAFATLNREGEAGTPPPESELRSGGTGSLLNWDEIGREGRKFVGGGPEVDDLRAFHEVTGRSAEVVEPIRVYAGSGGTADVRTRAQQVVGELERTGAFEREVLVVATVTGTGWIDPVAVDSLEYVHAGDTAVAAMQYSYLPSAISFIIDVDEARRAGRVLFEAVEARWLEEPESSRPKLIAYGESLGALGSAAAFADLDDVLARVDGAYWVGAPAASEPIGQWKHDREPGSPLNQPMVDDGRQVRFWNRFGPAGDLVGDYRDDANPAWDFPRVIVLQHASDPVVWWSPDLLLSEPEWLREPAGDAVLASFTWHPFVTFWQVAADMAASGQAPYGFAHRYGREQVEAWVALVPPERWNDELTEALADVLNVP